MNTAILSVEQARAFRAQWAALARNHETRKRLSRGAHLVRLLLLGLPVERGFSEVKNPVKRANGYSPRQGLRLAREDVLYQGRSIVVDTLGLGRETLDQLLRVLSPSPFPEA